MHKLGFAVNWDDMKVFLAVARTGSVSGAGKLLGVQHSTVSRRLNALEEKLGVHLVQRSTGGYRLTPAGEDFRNASERVESEVVSVENILLGQDKQLRGPIRVTVVNHIAHSLLMPMFARFSQEYPKIELQIQSSNAYISMPHRDADVALRVTNAPQETLIGKKIITFASAVYASREYLRHLNESGEQTKWIGTECCGFHRHWTEEVCPDKTHHFTIDDTGLAHMAIREGVGVSFLPCFIGDLDEALIRVPEYPSDYGLDLWMLFHTDLRYTARIAAFREFITAEIEAHRALLEGRCSNT